MIPRISPGRRAVEEARALVEDKHNEAMATIERVETQQITREEFVEVRVQLNEPVRTIRKLETAHEVNRNP